MQSFINSRLSKKGIKIKSTIAEMQAGMMYFSLKCQLHLIILTILLLWSKLFHFATTEWFTQGNVAWNQDHQILFSWEDNSEAQCIMQSPDT